MSRKNLYAFIISFVLLMTVIILNRLAYSKMKNYTGLVDHTREVITTFERLSNDFKSAQIFTPTYSDSLVNFYRLYKTEAESVTGEVAYLEKLTKDNASQKRLLDTISMLIQGQLGTLMHYNISELIKSGQGDRIEKIYTIHQLINKGISNEKMLLEERSHDLNQSTRLYNIITTALAIAAIGIIVTAFLSNLLMSKRRRWLEGFLESILNTSQNGVVNYKAIRDNGKIVDFRLEFMNKAIDYLLGIRSDDVLGKKLSEFPSYVRESGLMEKYVEVVESGKPSQFETLYQRGNIKRWLLVNLARLNDGVTASFHDISQLKHYEEELKENINDLERSNTELEQYAYVASHDLQEPLRKIRSFGSFLQDTQSSRLDERGKQQLEKMMNAAERMSVLIKDILTFSSLKKQGTMEPTDLNAVLKSVTQDLDLLITQKQAVIRAEPLPVIEAIPLQMTQLFYNMINNSLKFSSDERPLQIHIFSRKVDPKEKIPGLQPQLRYYEIIFNDNGIGFSQEYSEQIFGLFKRLNDKQFYPGSGIGLALCKKVVENHRGEIIAQGKENEGASFLVYLPERQS
ncbi:MAG: ATP-binding protein [Flavisolibacter sp.]